VQLAFNAVMHLWNKKPLKVYGSRMSESCLSILCHIINGEAIIKVSSRDLSYFDFIHICFLIHLLA